LAGSAGSTGPTGASASTGPTGPTGGGGGGGFFQNYTAGNYYTTQPFAQNAAGGVAGTGTVAFWPFWIGETVTIDAIGFAVNTAGVTGAFYNVGIYNDAGDCKPGALLGSAGGDNTFHAASSSTPISMSLQSPVQLTPGWYWLGYQYPDNTQKLWCQSSNGGGNSLWYVFSAGSSNLSNYNLAASIPNMGIKAASTAQSATGTSTMPNPGNTGGAYTETTNIIFPIFIYKVHSVP
jgi:hypothetical protein